MQMIYKKKSAARFSPAAEKFLLLMMKIISCAIIIFKGGVCERTCRRINFLHVRFDCHEQEG